MSNIIKFPKAPIREPVKPATLKPEERGMVAGPAQVRVDDDPADLAAAQVGSVDRCALSVRADGLPLEHARRVCRLDIYSAFRTADRAHLLRFDLQAKRDLTSLASNFSR